MPIDNAGDGSVTEVPPGTPQRPAARPLAVLMVVAALAAIFLLVLRSLALPLIFAAVVALLTHPAQEWLTRRLGGLGWLAAATLTLLLVVAVACPLALAVSVIYKETHGLLEAVGRRVQAAVEWASRRTGVEEADLRGWVRGGGEELEQALYHRSLRALGDLPGVAVGLAVSLVALFYFLKDGPRMVAAWEDITPLDNAYERLIHREVSRVCRGLVWSALAAAVAQGVALGAGLLALDLVAGTGLGGRVLLLAALAVACSAVPFLGATAVWVGTAAVFLLQGHYAAAAALTVYGAAVVSQIDTVVRVWVLNGATRMHPLMVLVSTLGGIQVLGVLGLVVGPVTAAVLLALLRALRAKTDRSPSKP